jgi:hypothetical protein
MTVESLASQMRALETQLAVVKAQIEQMGAPVSRKTFGELYGIFAGQGSISEADLEAAKYHFEWAGHTEG